MRFQVLTAAGIALMMEAESSSETLVYMYETLRRDILEGVFLRHGLSTNDTTWCVVSEGYLLETCTV
jgi:hypothetical protein